MFRRASQPTTQRLLGDFHFNGELGKPDRDAVAAVKRWRMAAERDEADGQAMLGVAYHLGAGAERDHVTALAWLTRTRAARSSFADRFYNAVRESCTPEQREHAERSAKLLLAAHEAAP